MITKIKRYFWPEKYEVKGYRFHLVNDDGTISGQEKPYRRVYERCDFSDEHFWWKIRDNACLRYLNERSLYYSTSFEDRVYL